MNPNPSISPFAGSYTGRRVFVTGHTGFKGAWLCHWLTALGADVTGFSNRVSEAPSLFTSLDLAGRLTHRTGDVREAKALADALADASPEIVFHLAAQPLVRQSYRDPSGTIETNVMGTTHLLDATRALPEAAAVVVITSDKCYENREWSHGYRENDRLGGHDPYSASKACAELITDSFRRSFFTPSATNPNCAAVATARAGNVIGGGDWSEDRIVPDCIRALRDDRPIVIRNPAATRPWQHVLEPLSGYLWLGAKLRLGLDTPGAPAPSPWREELCSAFNFGPAAHASRPVADLVDTALETWPGSWNLDQDETAPHEAGLLQLSADRAWHHLGWRPAWGFSQAVAATVAWYRDTMVGGTDPTALTTDQIGRYTADAAQAGIAWAGSPQP